MESLSPGSHSQEVKRQEFEPKQSDTRGITQKITLHVGQTPSKVQFSKIAYPLLLSLEVSGKSHC